jgi:hypothetical protein
MTKMQCQQKPYSLILLSICATLKLAIYCKKGNCNMSNETLSPARKQLHEALHREIAEKAAQIRQLVEEKEALERMLMKFRQQEQAISQSDVTRKNSRSRVLVENAILHALQTSKNPVRASALYRIARSLVPGLPDSTFRSYLHRMKDRSLIMHPSQGLWQPTKAKTESVG